MAVPESEPIGGSWAVGVDFGGESGPTIFRVNVGLHELGESSPFETAVLITVEFTDTDQQGLPTPETTAHLNELGNRVVAYLRAEGKGVLTSHLTTPGAGRTFSLYVESFDGVAQLFGSLLPPYRGRAVNVRSGHDPKWTVYQGQLAAARRGQPDVALLEQLRNDGVDLASVAIQEHYLRFPSSDAAERAADILAADGFTVVRPTSVDKGGWPVLVRVNDSLDLFTLAYWRKQFSGLSSRFGGTYDGWGVPMGGD
jgi:regulator of RNase E activity RraB